MTRPPEAGAAGHRVMFLQMTARPGYDWPHLPHDGVVASLLRAEAPPVWYFRALYAAVGRPHGWAALHEGDAELAAWLADPAVTLWSLIRGGWPQGFFLLDARAEGATQIAHLGLVPEAQGLGLGRFLVRTAILTAWERPGLQRLDVETSSRDHPRALAAYQRAGFSVVAQEERAPAPPAPLQPGDG